MMKYTSMIFSVALAVLLAPSASNASENAAFIDPAAGKCSALNDAGAFVFTTDTRVVMTRDPLTETTHLKCSFDTTPTLSGNAWVLEGFYCATFNPELGFMLTTDSQLRQTPNGKLTMQCHFSTAQ